MTVAYLISNYHGSSTGAGGHYYSLKTMAEAMGQRHEVLTVSVGQEVPKPFRNIPAHVHVKASLFWQERAIGSLLSLFRSRGVRVIHSYDVASSYLGYVLATLLKVPFFLTKCGGPRPRSFFPKIPHLFVFHMADFDFFRKLPRLSETKVELLPHRVNPPVYDEERAGRIFGKKPEGQIAFFRIGRIGEAYKHSVQSAMELVEKARSVGVQGHLYIIGHVQSEKVLAGLKERASEWVTFVTEPENTVNASELLGFSDAVIGTGRGFIEALASKKVVFFPVQNERLPRLASEWTFPHAFQENFSERVTLPETCLRQDDDLVFLNDCHWQSEVGEWGYRVYKENFDAAVGSERLCAAYESASPAVLRGFMSSLLLHRVSLFCLGLLNKLR